MCHKLKIECQTEIETNMTGHVTFRELIMEKVHHTSQAVEHIIEAVEHITEADEHNTTASWFKSNWFSISV